MAVVPDASATTDHHRRMSCGVVSHLRAIRSSTRKDRSSRPRRGELPGIELNRPARRGPLPMGPREEIQAIRQLDRALLAHEDHPRAIRIVLGDREAVLSHRGRTYVRMAVKSA
jgi:hypothetical protein